MSGVSAVVAYKSGDTFIENIKGEYDLPMIVYTPERIFSNDIPLFNINFFNPSIDKVESQKVTTKKITTLSGTRIVSEGVMQKIDKNTTTKTDKSKTYYDSQTGEYDWDAIYYDYTEYNADISNCFANWYNALQEIDRTDTVVNVLMNYPDITVFTSPSTLFAEELLAIIDIHDIDRINKAIETCNNGYKNVVSIINAIELDQLTDEEKQIIAKNISTLNAKIETEETEEVVATYESSARILQRTVSSMYKTLRTVAIVALLSILVYVGIRMVISSTSKDKAKYKQMLIDWLVAFIMLFVLHYIMAFIIDTCEKLTEICNNSNIENIQFEIPGNTLLYNEESGNFERAPGYNTNENRLMWGSNFVGYIRFYAGLVQQKGYTLKGVSYTIMYVVLVIYTVMFTFQYMKRVLYMAFLTMIAPLVAITYPLDKVNDGKAQGFNMWLREYIFNALLQPIHYVIYVIIMGSVMTMVVNHPVYALVALGFMVPAEKFIRKMFGFEKAGTVGAFGGAAGAAMLMSGVQRLTHRPHGKKNDDNGAKGEHDNPNGKIRSLNALPKGPEGDGSTPNGGSNIPIGGGTDNSGVTQGANPLRIRGGLAGGNENNNPEWHSRLTQDQIGELKAEGIMPGDQEYSHALWNYGINPTEPSQNNNPRATISTGTITPSPVNPTPSQVSTNIRRQEPSASRTLYNRPKSGGFINGLRAVGGHYTRRLDNRLRKAHPLRAIRRGLTYAAGAATLGTIGLAAGIASGDPSKALQYTMAGGIAGGNLGKNLGETASNIVGLEGAAKTFKKGVLGDAYNDIERQRYKRDFKNNVSNYDAGVKKVGTNGWKDMSKEGGIIDTGLDYGINNVDDLSNIYRAQQIFMNDPKYNMDEEEAKKWAFAAYDLDKKFGDIGENSKTEENLRKVLKSRGIPENDIEDVRNKMVETMEVYQNASLDGNERIEEPIYDYTRMPYQTQNNEQDERILTEQSREQVRTTEQSEAREEQENYNRDYLSQILNNPTGGIVQEDSMARATAVNAQRDAEKAARQQFEQNRKIQKELEERAKAERKTEVRMRANREKSKNVKAKRKNNVVNGEQGSSVNEFDSTKRNVKVNPIDLRSNSNPISSDSGTNGDGPIHTPKK